jgi:proline iminopeptidase
VPNSVLVKLPTLAHGALDSREPAALAVACAVCRGEVDGLAERGQELDAMPPRPGIRLLCKALDVAVAAEAALPTPPRRLVRLLAAT